MKKILSFVLSISLSVSAMESKKVLPAEQRALVGLENVGNSCFINAALQCLYSMDLMTAALLSKSETFYVPGSISHCYVNFLKTLLLTRKERLTPLSFCLKSWEMLELPAKTAQDAAEFVDKLLSHLTDKDIQRDIKKLLPFYEHTKQLKTDIADIISSLIDSSIIPQLPGHMQDKDYAVSTRTEPYTVLRLPLPASSKTLSDCFNLFFAREHMVGRACYEYKKNFFVDAIKLLKLRHIPSYLIVGLNRKGITFTPDVTFTKETMPIAFPLEGLNMAPYFGDNTLPNNTLYALQAFVVHAGSTQSGHYSAYVKRDNQWYYCNDEFVLPIGQDQITTIATRGYGFDPAYLTGLNEAENLTTSKAQTPILFFYAQAGLPNTVFPAITEPVEELEPFKETKNDKLTPCLQTPSTLLGSHSVIYDRAKVQKATEEVFRETYQAFGFTAKEVFKLSPRKLEILIQAAQENLSLKHPEFIGQ